MDNDQSRSQGDRHPGEAAWDEPETHLLINVYGRYYDDMYNTRNRVQKQAIFDRLAADFRTESALLQNHHTPRTDDQIKKKWNELDEEFKRQIFVHSDTIGSPNPPPNSTLYIMMYDIFKNYATYFPPATYSSLSRRFTYNTDFKPVIANQSSVSDTNHGDVHNENSSRIPTTQSGFIESRSPFDEEPDQPEIEMLGGEQYMMHANRHMAMYLDELRREERESRRQ